MLLAGEKDIVTCCVLDLANIFLLYVLDWEMFLMVLVCEVLI